MSWFQGSSFTAMIKTIVPFKTTLMKTSDFNNKTIWITGASSGIGASLALQLNASGATIIASARNEKKLKALKTQARHPQNLIALPLDIT